MRITASSGNSISLNLISGNSLSGVQITGLGATLNIVSSNTIGLGTGGVTIGNTFDGVLVTGSGANDNTIGSGNVISSNGRDGVRILTGPTRNQVVGNSIGVDATGLIARGNGGDGVLVSNASGNVIGATGLGNTISGQHSERRRDRGRRDEQRRRLEPDRAGCLGGRPR